MAHLECYLLHICQGSQKCPRKAEPGLRDHPKSVSVGVNTRCKGRTRGQFLSIFINGYIRGGAAAHFIFKRSHEPPERGPENQRTRDHTQPIRRGCHRRLPRTKSHSTTLYPHRHNPSKQNQPVDVILHIELQRRRKGTPVFQTPCHTGNDANRRSICH